MKEYFQKLFKSRRKKKVKLKLKIPKKPAKAPKPKVKKTVARPRIRISPRRRKPRRERGVLTAEVYRTIMSLVVEGLVFGALAAVVLYVALTGLLDSPIITYIADFMGLDRMTSFLLFMIPIGALTGLLASDLTIKSQKGISLLTILSRKKTREARPARAATRTLPLHPGRIGLAGLSLMVPATGLLLVYVFPRLRRGRANRGNNDRCRLCGKHISIHNRYPPSTTTPMVCCPGDRG